MLAEKVCELLYPEYKFSEFGRLFLKDEAFIKDFRRLESNHHSLDRKYALDQLVRLTLDVEGDTAECGAFRGASSFFVCRQTVGLGKQHHIFDSFEGLSLPAAVDGDYWKKGDLFANEQQIRANLRGFDFVSYYRGWIPERFNEVANRKFSFVHVDVDLHQPTRDSLDFFYERMSGGGIILCDDYGFASCPGAKKAMDDFFAGKPEPIVALPTGQAFVIKRAA